MTNQSNPSLKAKYERILRHERSWAFTLASSLKKQRPISVWEVLMPIFLIFNFAKSRADRDFLARNFLFTKELALEGALKIVDESRTQAEVLNRIQSKTDRILNSDENSIYSEDIRASQIEEIALLIDHYGRMLRSEGSDFSALTVSAYGTKPAYLSFLSELKKAEDAVNEASLRTLGSRGDPEFVATIQENSERLRLASADKIFGD